MIDTPIIVRTEAQRAAVIHLTIPRDQIQQVMGPAIEEILTALKAQGVGPSGPVFAHYLRMTPGMFDLEVGVPVSASVQATGRVEPSELPAAEVIRTVYTGPYEKLCDAWAEFIAVIAADAHEFGPSLWETYLTGPESNPDPQTWRTELNRTLAARR